MEVEPKSVPELWSKGHKMVAGNAKEDTHMQEAAVPSVVNFKVTKLLHEQELWVEH